MHIKHIHETIEKLSQYACEEACKNKESINTEELGEVIDMVKDLSEAEYYARISKAMEEAGKEEEEEAKYIMKKMKEEYGEEEGERRFYDNYRYKSSGRFAPKGRGSYMPIRGYEEMMMPEIYNPMEYMRDVDRGQGRMYFSGTETTKENQSANGMGARSTRGHEEYQRGYSEGRAEGYNQGRNDGRNSQSRDYREGRSGTSRRGYMESRENHKDNTPESKQANMKELEKYMKSLSEDLTEAIEGASNEEKTMLKSKLQTLVQKIQ